MQRIEIESIPLDSQRYDTLGDWFYDSNDTLQIKVSHEDGDCAFLIAIHELVEAYLCQHRGITQRAVDDFDLTFSPEGDEEPGDSAISPYRREHRFAMIIEHLMAHELGIKNYGEVK